MRFQLDKQLFLQSRAARPDKPQIFSYFFDLSTFEFFVQIFFYVVNNYFVYRRDGCVPGNVEIIDPVPKIRRRKFVRDYCCPAFSFCYFLKLFYNNFNIISIFKFQKNFFISKQTRMQS